MTAFPRHRGGHSTDVQLRRNCRSLNDAYINLRAFTLALLIVVYSIAIPHMPEAFWACVLYQSNASTRNWKSEALRQIGTWFIAHTFLHIYSSVTRIPPLGHLEPRLSEFFSNTDCTWRCQCYPVKLTLQGPKDLRPRPGSLPWLP